jgi:hypothetical protein
MEGTGEQNYEKIKKENKLKRIRSWEQRNGKVVTVSEVPVLCNKAPNVFAVVGKDARFIFIALPRMDSLYTLNISNV